MQKSKYRAKKVTYEGETFDSKKELSRWLDLKGQQEQGEIKNLQRQVIFPLLPSQRNADGKVIERPVKYVADFVYVKDGETIVEDVKGIKTDAYILKRKMMLYFNNVRIKET